ncbi:hypothetical protein [uncultured Psychroserpens sp.]|uniref:hypothetical protein n=1 Tax=uncultured Psychroserpens sp. TaxID=255436 RepID=UPI002613A640|nr:hypothetical protein [uncultured Psychroserpens sp.]
MKKLLTYFTAFTVSLIINAQDQQNLSVVYGSVFKNDKREIPVDIVGKDDNGYYLLYSEGRFGQGDDMYLRKFNLDLTPSGQEINLKSETYDGKFNSLGLAKIKEDIVHLFYVLNSEGKTYYHQTVSLNDFTLGKKTKITTISNDTKKAINSVSRFIISEDDELITMFYTIPNKGKEHTKFRIQTFDSNFNEQSNRFYEFPFDNNVLSIRNVFTNDDNELFIICKKYDSKKILYEDDNFGYEYLIYKVKLDGLEKLAMVRPNEVHMRGLTPTLVNENELLLTGLFSKVDKYSMTGIYATKIDLQSGHTIYSKYNKFSAEFFSQLFKPGKKKDKAIVKYNQGKREDPNYVLKKAIPLENDELLVLAEQMRTYSYNYVTTYYHDNIAAIKLDNTGNVVWTNKIGKRQEKVNVPIYNSFYPTMRGDKLFLLYNCNINNLNHKNGKLSKPFNTSEYAFIATVLDDDGNYNRQIISTKEALKGVTIRPLLYNWEDENTLLMFGQDIDNLKNQRFIKVRFN